MPEQRLHSPCPVPPVADDTRRGSSILPMSETKRRRAGPQAVSAVSSHGSRTRALLVKR